MSAPSSASTLKELSRLKAPFSLPKLPYSSSSLEPVVDQVTMETHHGKHHQAYVTKANEALAADSSSVNLGEMLKTISSRSMALRNNAGGHWNHSFFWLVLTPDKSRQKMPSRLQKQIENAFGSFEKMKDQLEAAGTGLFGSGWVWLIRNANGDLAITTTINQDNPLMDVVSVKGQPVFAIDVWEHAYYLKYQNRRAEYLKQIWSIVDWTRVDQFDQEALKNRKIIP